MGHFSIIDLFIVIIMAWCIVRSWMKGFIHEVLWIVTVLAGILLAGFFYQRTAPLFKDLVKTENIAFFVAFATIFLGTLLVGGIIIFLVTRFMKFAKLQPADRMLGAAFGFVRGWAFATVLLLAFTAFDVQTERVKNSAFAPYFLPGSRVMAVITPFDLKARFLVGYRSVERWWRDQK